MYSFILNVASCSGLLYCFRHRPVSQFEAFTAKFSNNETVSPLDIRISVRIRQSVLWTSEVP